MIQPGAVSGQKVADPPAADTPGANVPAIRPSAANWAIDARNNGEVLAFSILEHPRLSCIAIHAGVRGVVRERAWGFGVRKERAYRGRLGENEPGRRRD